MQKNNRENIPMGDILSQMWIKTLDIRATDFAAQTDVIEENTFKGLLSIDKTTDKYKLMRKKQLMQRQRTESGVGERERERNKIIAQSDSTGKITVTRFTSTDPAMALNTEILCDGC